MKIYSIILVTTGISLLLFGCNPKKLTNILPARATPISVLTTSETNQNSAVAIDFIAVYNESIARGLQKLNAAEWFNGKEQFIRDYTSGEDYDIWHYEFAALAQRHDIKIKPQRKLSAIYIFADYLSPGKHRYRFTKIEEMMIILAAKDFRVTHRKGTEIPCE